jgi:hypothetical protein
MAAHRQWSRISRGALPASTLISSTKPFFTALTAANGSPSVVVFRSYAA